MARYLGAACRKMRRNGGTDLALKSRRRDVSTKCKLTTPPGQHGQKKARVTNYGTQLKAKQTLRIMYGLLEKQFLKYYHIASRKKGATGEVLLQLLESRLDNVVYRAGFGSTRAEARQLVKHKAILINDKVANVPSEMVNPGDKISVREKSKGQLRIQEALCLAESAGFPEWVDVDSKGMSCNFKRVPDRTELPAELNEQLVVELYSK